MCYTEEEIKRYTEILDKYTKPPEEKSSKAGEKQSVVIAKEMIVFLFTQDINYVKIVVF